MSRVPKVGPDAVQASPQLQGSPETKVTAAQAARDKRGAKRRSETSRMGARTRERQAWEASPEGQKRTRDIVDIATEHHNKIARERPELGLKEQSRLNLSPAQVYEARGFHQENVGPGMGERQLPGMEDPDALAQPKRWEDHTPEEQAKIQRDVKIRSGATIDSMKRDLGSQVDQAYHRAASHGHDTPYGADFYTSGKPAQVLRDTAKKTGASLGLVAATNADTSPQMKFEHIDSKTGESRYPNAEVAEHAIRHAQAGKDPETASKDGLHGVARAGFTGNLRKAARRATAVIREGKGVGATFAGENGTSGFGPKTAAYHNSWLPSTPDFLVSDRHTGHGALAHVSPTTPAGEGTYDSGTQKRGKSPVEHTVEIPGYHAMADYAARQAMKERGLEHVRQFQGAQWGEEKIQRGEAGNSKQAPKPEQVYPPVNRSQFHNPDQGSLF